MYLIHVWKVFWPFSAMDQTWHFRTHKFITKYHQNIYLLGMKLPVQEYIPVLVFFVNEFLCTKMSRWSIALLCPQYVSVTIWNMCQSNNSHIFHDSNAISFDTMVPYLDRNAAAFCSSRPKDWSARLNAIQHLPGFTCLPTHWTCWHGRSHSLLVYSLEAGNVHFWQGTFFGQKSIKSTFRFHVHCILKTLTNMLNGCNCR